MNTAVLFAFLLGSPSLNELHCELSVLPENQSDRLTTTFSVPLGTPAKGEFQGYEYYLTYQKTTKRAVTYQVSRDDSFFLHGSSDQPENEVNFSGLGFDHEIKNSVYLGCSSAK